MCVSNVLVRHPFWCTNRVLRALILLMFPSFRIWGWRDFEQLSLALHAPACVYMRHPFRCKNRVLRALILLVFRSFRIVFFAWQGLDCCWRSGVSEPKLCFLWVPKVTWSILSACFLLGMGSNLAGVSVFSDLRLTSLWAAIVSTPRSGLCVYTFWRC